MLQVSGFIKRSTILAVCLLFIFSLCVTLLPATVFAADEGFSAVQNKTGKPHQEISITDLQVSGTGNDDVSVRISTETGEFYFDDWADLDFTISEDRLAVFSGPRETVNTVLASMRYSNPQAGTHTIKAVLGDGNYLESNGHVYKVTAAPDQVNGITWEDAKAAAESATYGGVNGYLATITSQEEHNFIRERINSNGWIGANDIASEGVWRWQTGPEAGTQFWAGDEAGSVFNGAFANWNPDEPNNSGEGENCAQIYFDGDSDGRWNDLDCNATNNKFYVVEFGGNTPESLPEIVSTSFNVNLAKGPTQQVISCDQLFTLGAEFAYDDIELLNDIDCGGRTEAPMFDEEDFYGVFEGNGFTIKNLTLANEDGDHVGLTGYSVGATYRNLFLDTIKINGDYHNGILAGHVDESIIAENIHATNITINGVSHKDDEEDELRVEEMGILFGTMDLEHQFGVSRLEHVSVQGSFVMNGLDRVESVGGIAGYIEVEGDFIVKQVYADVQISIGETTNRTENVGGLIGYIESDGQDDNADKDVVQGLTDSYSWGNISAPDGMHVGGLIGRSDSSTEDNADAAFTINNSYSWMNITADKHVGGLVGTIETMTYEGGEHPYTISNSFYSGTVTGNSDTGIIVGVFQDSNEEFSTLGFENNWYDTNKAADLDCVSNMSVDECNGANQPNYFIANSTNAPMDTWDFDTIWRAQSGTPPVFKPFIGNDGDQDGVNNYIESRAPNGGDANNDGTPDSEQANVASFVNSLSGTYTSVALPENCSITSASASAESTDVKDGGYNYATGLTGFSADCPEASTAVQIFQYGAATSGLVARKFNPNTNAYFTIPGATVSYTVIDGQNVAIATYTIIDNGELDLEPIIGKIKDPVGLGNLVVSAPNTGFKKQ